MWVGFSMKYLAKQGRWHCRVYVFYSFSDRGIYNSKITACYYQTVHKTEFQKVTDLASDKLHIIPR